jgi:UDP-N-acetylmuramoyl-L-alanyl-D-glutamate--2,6-diaminopimelate ligase
MRLAHLLARTTHTRVTGPVDRSVGVVTDRDANVTEGAVFVAIRGARVDGHDRAPALAQAAAVVVERPVRAAPGVTVIEVPDTRVALAQLCAASHAHPAEALPVIGVTGTNGKTSTTFLLAAIARAAGRVPGIIGTTGHFVGDTQLPTTHTTPDAPTTQALLARMRESRAGLVAMEVSSIGLAARRCDAIPFRAAVFTNLTRDHLDYHGTMEAYADAKARLFTELLAGPAILNGQDPWTPALRARISPATTCWTHAVDADADLRADLEELSWRGTRARVRTPEGTGTLSLQVLGRHNVQNALGALGAALAVGIPLDAALAGLAACTGIPGRLQSVPNTRGFTVLVDYAHTDDALARVLGELRMLGPKRILTVFGCGGDRDKGKRPLMGAAAAAGSDLVVLTSDNPRSEAPEAILRDILPGVGSAPHRVVPDRRDAIRLALAEAGPGDIVLLAGKGHEATQTIGDTVLPFSDAAVAAEELA